MRKKRKFVPLNRNVVVAIDPGVDSGLAVFDLPENLLTQAFVVKGKGDTWDERCADLIEKTHGNLRTLSGFPMFTRILIEYPLFIPTPGGVATAKKGSLVKLSYLCGRLHESLRVLGPVERVPVNTWKGQVSKEVMERRIKKLLSREELQVSGISSDCSHDWDATGIGLWALGRLK